MNTTMSNPGQWIDLSELQGEIDCARSRADISAEYLRLRRIIFGDLDIFEISKTEAMDALSVLDAEYGFVGSKKEKQLSDLLNRYPDLLLDEERKFAHVQHEIRVQNACESACRFLCCESHQECEKCFQEEVQSGGDICPVHVEALQQVS